MVELELIKIYMNEGGVGMGNDEDNLMKCAKGVICLYDGLMRHSAYI
jgi:hypothetical protein